MSEKRANENVVDWQLTAATIYCDAVDEEVTLLVYKDRSTKCTGYQKYSQPDRDTAKAMKIKSKQSGRKLECEGLECYRVTEYRHKLFAEGSK